MVQEYATLFMINILICINQSSQKSQQQKSNKKVHLSSTHLIAMCPTQFKVPTADIPYYTFFFFCIITFFTLFCVPFVELVARGSVNRLLFRRRKLAMTLFVLSVLDTMLRLVLWPLQWAVVVSHSNDEVDAAVDVDGCALRSRLRPLMPLKLLRRCNSSGTFKLFSFSLGCIAVSLSSGASGNIFSTLKPCSSSDFDDSLAENTFDRFDGTCWLSALRPRRWRSSLL